jgi:hypothetical protein
MNFDIAESDFQYFAMKEGYPAALLWTTAYELAFWRQRFWVLTGNNEGRRERAKAVFERTAAKNVGMMIDGKCRTDGFTIFGVYVPKDEADDQYCMIPQAGVKVIVALSPPETVLVQSKAFFAASNGGVARNAHDEIGFER